MVSSIRLDTLFLVRSLFSVRDRVSVLRLRLRPGPPLMCEVAWLAWLVSTSGLRGPSSRSRAEIGEIWVELSSWCDSCDRSTVVLVTLDPELELDSLELLWLDTLSNPLAEEYTCPACPAACLPPPFPLFRLVSMGVKRPVE